MNTNESGEKYLLNNAVVPAGQSGIQDIEAAIDNLFKPSECGSFRGETAHSATGDFKSVC